MHLLMLWHNMASALLISAKPLLALFGVAIGVAGLFDGVAGPFDHPRSGELAGMHLLMPSLTLLMHMLTPMAPMGTGPTGSNLLRVSPIKWSSQRLSHMVTVNILMSSWEQAAIQGSCWTCLLPYQSSRVPRGVCNQRTPAPRLSRATRQGRSSIAARRVARRVRYGPVRQTTNDLYTIVASV